jgi:hypothetical protein
MSSPELQDVTRAKVNLETARIAWRELQRFFASGAAIYVNPEVDLVEAAFQISEDNKEQVLAWMQARLLAPVTDAQALAWHEADADMWAVVVSPYVLVQPDEKGLQ